MSIEQLGIELGRALRNDLRSGAPAVSSIAEADAVRLFSVEDADELITRRGLRAPFFRIVRDGGTLPPAEYTVDRRVGSTRFDDLVEPGRALDLVAIGSTLVFQGLQNYWPPLRTLCASLADVAGQPIQANAYLSPRAAEGLSVHYDTHDVLAIQLAGRKSWRVARLPTFEAPLRTRSSAATATDPVHLALPEDSLEVDFATGDSLFIPRGFAHYARTTSTWSLHLTLGVNSITRWDVLRQAIDESSNNPALRQRFADDPGSPSEQDADDLVSAFSTWLKQVSMLDIHADVLRRRQSELLSPSSPRLRDLLELDTISDDSVLRLRSNTHLSITKSADGARSIASLEDRTLNLPGEWWDLLEFLVTAEGPVQVGDLSAFAEQVVRLEICRRLVREGLLELAD